ncbi:MAG: hypothetical protein WD018_02825, partial [Nitrosopumilaceae archaeon]
MNPPRISFSFLSQLIQLPESFRIFVITSIISVYGLILYELFPELIFDINNAVSSFIIPIVALAGLGIGLPRYMPIIMEKIFKKPMKKSTNLAETQSDDILNELVTQGSSQQLLEPGSSYLVGGESGSLPEIGNKELDDIISGAVQKERFDPNTVGMDPTSLAEGSHSGLGTEGIRDLVDQKFEPVEKDLSSFKKDL